MIVEGTAVVIDSDNVDTDVLYPGQFLNVLEPERMRDHLFEGLDPTLRDQLVGDTVLVVGENFGMGSSRENVPQAMLASGVRCVVGKSFARIFQRNCFNLGLLVVVAPTAAERARPGSTIRVELETDTVEVDGAPFTSEPLPGFVRDMVGSGGLVGYAQRRLAGRETS